MKKIVTIVLTAVFFLSQAYAQIQNPSGIKKDTSIRKIMGQKTPAIPAPAPVKTQPVYSLSSVRVTIRTGNDNKENGANMIFFCREKDGVWGKGKDLFQSGSKSEFRINTNTDLLPDRVSTTAAASYTLDNLQARGLYFAVYYSPAFFADAWKIESITVTLEFKDQFGNLHPTFGNRVVQYSISNGLLTNANFLLKATADGAFFTPSAVTVTNTF